jgi:uncharacterized protein (DUF2236 family)
MTARTPVTLLPLTPGVPLLGRTVRAVLTRMFGPPPFAADRDPGDPGLTGPGSASWRVIGDPAAIAGGIRGLLVQVSHPHAMAGVHDHSAFREDPLGRLQRTSAYVTTSAFGSVREALAVAGRVRAVHPRVRGTAPDGTPYRGDDPHLLTWVSVALTSSFLAAHRRWAPDVLTAAEEDAFVAQQARIGALLDPRVDLRSLRDDPDEQAAFRAGARDASLPLIAEGRLPVTATALETVMARFAPELGVNHQGREALAFLRRPPIPRVARPGYRVLLEGAIGSLDPVLRHALELDATAARADRLTARAGAALTLMRVATGSSPSIRAAWARATAAPATAAPATGTRSTGAGVDHSGGGRRAAR